MGLVQQHAKVDGTGLDAHFTTISWLLCFSCFMPLSNYVHDQGRARLRIWRVLVRNGRMLLELIQALKSSIQCCCKLWLCPLYHHRDVPLRSALLTNSSVMPILVLPYGTALSRDHRMGMPNQGESSLNKSSTRLSNF